MKKYFQVSFFLGIFCLVVFLKNNTKIGNEKLNSIVAKSFIVPSPSLDLSTGKYKDGKYTGTVEDAFYGFIQVQAEIKNKKLSDITFLQYPNDNNTSRRINEKALIILKSEAIQAQSSQVDIVTGASDSSPAFSRSLASALRKAQ